MKVLRILDDQSRSSLTAIGFLAIAGVGLVDYITGHELSFSIFYLLPVSMLAWHVGVAMGVVASVVSAGAWLTADLLTGAPYSHPAIPYWNAFVRLGVFVIVAAILGFLRKSETRREELLSFIVHDLRSPLTNVMMGIEILKARTEQSLDKRHREYVDICMASCRRMLTLTNAILDLSRLEAGRMRFDIDDRRLVVLIEQALDQLSLSALQKNVSLHADLPDADLLVRADADATVRILVNLVSNAVKFTPPDSDVRVDVRRNGDHVVITVTDEGEGIPEEWADRVFDKFVQVESQREGTAIGSGVGLAYARLAVEAQGGRIWLNTDLEKGTAVSFTLPAADSN